MDYEKKYKEALSKARSIIEDYKNRGLNDILSYAQEDLSTIFPELKESEDEKTKRLLHTIANKMSQHLRDIFTEEEFQCFDTWSNAWLKKQGEQKPTDKVEPKFREGDIIKHKDTNETFEVSKIEVIDKDEIYYHLTNGGCICENVDNFERVEQKPTNNQFTPEQANVLDKHIDKFLEQKPAEWSEEDKIMLQYAIEHFERQKRNCIEGGDRKKAMQEFIDWLKSLTSE